MQEEDDSSAELERMEEDKGGTPPQKRKRDAELALDLGENATAADGNEELKRARELSPEDEQAILQESSQQFFLSLTDLAAQLVDLCLRNHKRIPEGLATTADEIATRIRLLPAKVQIRHTGVEASSQTLSPRALKELSAAEKIWAMVDEGVDDQALKTLVGQEWPHTAYRRTRLEKRSIFKLQGLRIVILDPVADSAAPQREALCREYPVVRKVLEQSPPDAKIYRLQRSDTVESEDGGMLGTPDNPLWLAFVRTGEDALLKSQEVLEKVKVALAEETCTIDQVTVACSSLPPGTARKLVEYTMRKHDKQIYVCVDRRRTTAIGQRGQRRAGSRPHQPQRILREEILVSADGQSFSEVLKNIRNTVGAVEETQVQAITKTSTGAKIILQKGDVKGAETICQALRAAHPDVRADIKSQRPTIMLQGLDAEVTTQEVEKAITGVAGSTAFGMVVRGLRERPGDTRAAVVDIPRAALERLQAQPRLRVGPVWGLITELPPPLERCFKCWGVGHRSHHCKGPDRRNLCFKCGQAGHTVARCTNEQQCISCGSRSHRTGSSECRTPIRHAKN